MHGTTRVTRAGACVALFALAVPARGLGAAPPPLPLPPRPTAVVLLPRANPMAAHRAMRALRGQFSDLQLTLVVEWTAAAAASLEAGRAAAREVARRRGANTVIWFDPARAQTLFVYVSSEASERVVVRTVEQTPSAGRLEALAIIARASIRALLHGEEVAVARPPSEPSPRRLAIDLAYTLDGYASEAPVTHGLALGAAYRVHPRWVIFADVRIHTAAMGEGAVAAVRVRRWPLSLGARVEWELGRWRVAGAAAAGVEIATAEPQDLSVGLVERADTGAVIATFAPSLRAALTLDGPATLFAEAGAVVALNPARYVAKTRDGDQALLVPWRVLPRLTIGLSVAIF